MWRGGITPVILDLGYYIELRGQVHSPAALPPGIPGARLITGWKGPRANMDVFKQENYFALAGIPTPGHPARDPTTITTTVQFLIFMYLVSCVNRVENPALRTGGGYGNEKVKGG